MTDSFDYVVIGAGSAGCVLANRLSADGTTTVALLEAGGRDWNPWIHVPVGYFKTIHNPKTDWCYVTEPDPGLNGRQLKWPRGKVLGGCSSINGLLYVRGQHQDYDRWASLGCRGWSYKEVLPYFKRSENHSRGADEFHGVDGPLHVSDMSFKRPVCDDFIKGVAELGTPMRDDINAEDQEGVGYFQLTTHKGRRCSTAVAYLNGARSRANLSIITHAMVKRIGFDNKHASSVHIEQKVSIEKFAHAVKSSSPPGQLVRHNYYKCPVSDQARYCRMQGSRPWSMPPKWVRIFRTTCKFERCTRQISQ